MKKIEVFIIGAQKAGTTSLYDWLGQSPEISAPKEIKDYHFVTQDEEFNKGWEHLESFFESNKLKVHAAVNYIYFSKVSAKRIYEYNPDAKIFICLRNPVDRAISAYKYFIRTLKESEKNFDLVIERELNGHLYNKDESDLTYLEHGKYANQVKDYLEYFSENNIHFILFENVIKNPSLNKLEEIFSFINVSNSHHINFTHQNKSGNVKSKLLNILLRNDYPFKSVIKIIPFSYRKKIGVFLNQKNITDGKMKIDVSREAKDYLYKYYESTFLELEDLVDMEFQHYWGYKL